MRTLTSILASSFAIALMTGCAASRLRPPTPPVLQSDTLSADAATRYKTLVAAYNQAVDANDLAKAEPLRNSAANLVLAEIEDAYREFESKLFASHAGVQVGADALELGLAGIAAVSNGERGKTILATVLSGVTGTRLSFDKNLFRQQTVQAVIAAMRANRDRLRTRIYSDLQTKQVGEYPFEAARADMIELFYAGTLQGALQQLHQASSAKAEQAQEELHQTRLMSAVSAQELETSRALRSAVAAAMQTPEGQETIRSFLQGLGTQDASSLSGPALEEALRTALRDTVSAEARAKLLEEARKAQLIQ